MRKSYSKIRHIQEANQRLERRVLSEKNWFSKIGDYFRGPESEEYDDEDKWAKTQKQMDDYESNPSYTQIYISKPGTQRPITYKIKSVDDCSQNSVFYNAPSNTALIDYCGYDGQETIEELDEMGDESWMELKRQAEDGFDRDVKRGNRPNRYLKSKEEDVMESELVDYIRDILNEEIKKDEMSIIRSYYKGKGWKNFQCNSKDICGLSLQCGDVFLMIENSKSPLGGIEVRQTTKNNRSSGQDISILEKSKTEIIKDIKNAIMYGLKKYEKDIKNCTNIESKL